MTPTTITCPNCGTDIPYTAGCVKCPTCGANSAAGLQKLKDKVLDTVCTDLSTNSLSYQQLEVLFTKKLNEK